MVDSLSNDIVFADGLRSETLREYGDYVLHVMCTCGSFSFCLNNERYLTRKGSYVILPNPLLVSDLHTSDDFGGYVIFLSNSFISHCTPNNNYGVFGHISNLRHPVMQLDEADYDRCREDLEMVSRRIHESDHLFHRERMGALVQNHVLDLYDIHARKYQRRDIPERAGRLMLQFIRMLDSGEYRRHRDLAHYADRLCIVPHYLSEICISVSGKPASFWIETYTRNDIIRQLRNRSMSFTDIADAFNFSSLSYFTRYVKKVTGLTPSEFRNQ